MGTKIFYAHIVEKLFSSLCREIHGFPTKTVIMYNMRIVSSFSLQIYDLKIAYYKYISW